MDPSGIILYKLLVLSKAKAQNKDYTFCVSLFCGPGLLMRILRAFAHDVTAAMLVFQNNFN
jgi:hypothetical protein